MYQLDQAITEYDSLYHLHVQKFGKTHSRTLFLLHSYTAALMHNGSYDKLYEIEDIITECISSDSVQNLGLRLKLRYAMLMGKLARYELIEADVSFQELLQDSMTVFGKEHLFTINVMQALASIYTDRFELADALYLYDIIWNFKKNSP